MDQIQVEALHLNQVAIEVLDLQSLINQKKVLGIKKEKEKVDLNVGEIALHQEDLEVVINQYQRKDVHLQVVKRLLCYHLNKNFELYLKQLYQLVKMIAVMGKLKKEFLDIIQRILDYLIPALDHVLDL